MPGWKGVDRPPRTPMAGQYCRVEPIDPARHAEDLYRANALDPSNRNFTYLLSGPFTTFDAYRQWLESIRLGDDPVFHAIVDAETGKARPCLEKRTADSGTSVRGPAASGACATRISRNFKAETWPALRWAVIVCSVVEIPFASHSHSARPSNFVT